MPPLSFQARTEPVRIREGQFRELRPQTERIVRHITRPAAPNELDGQDYHFVDDSQFTDMVERDVFIEHSTYPDCMAGTSRTEVIDKLRRTEFASMAANFEEGLTLHKVLGVSGSQYNQHTVSSGKA